MTAGRGIDLVVRPFDAGDEAAVLGLLAVSLGWVPDDHHAAFFAWKHRQNPYGPSPAWVAERDGAVIGFRSFLRWEFEHAGQVWRAVRAVDTATAPEHRKGGVFTALTTHGLDALRTEGVQFVFNTPNAQSLPGYLRMGWEQVGRVPVFARPGSLAAVRTMASSRTAADLWSLPTAAGVPAGEALADHAAVGDLLATVPADGRIRTRRSPASLAWRYAGFEPLAYRALTLGGGVAEGLALFRLRRRGPAVEAVIGEVLVPGGDWAAAARLARTVLRATNADYAICCGPPSVLRAGFLPLPRTGPLLTWKGLALGQRPGRAAWRLTLGDVELF